MAPALLWTLKVEFNNKNETKYPVNRGVGFVFAVENPPLADYYYHYYSDYTIIIITITMLLFHN